MTILDGRKTSAAIKEEIAKEVQEITEKGLRKPHLAAIIVGGNPASKTYVASKDRACKKVGLNSTILELDEQISEGELIAKIRELNTNDDIDGFIVQLPLPKHIDEQKVLLEIDPEKDVDGFHPTNFGKMALDLPAFLPATPFGIMELLKRYRVETEGKDTVVIGRSHIVGRPMSILLSRKSTPGNATVTLTHRHTKNLKELTSKADIIVVAMGKPHFLTADMVKEGAVIIDVGINRVPDKTTKKGYVIQGDADFENLKEKVSFITPVPGGVGPMTVTMLLKNTLRAYKNHQKKEAPSTQ